MLLKSESKTKNIGSAIYYYPEKGENSLGKQSTKKMNAETVSEFLPRRKNMTRC